MTVHLIMGASFLWLLNYAGLLFAGTPIVYCWGGTLLRPVLAPYAQVLLLLTSLYFFYCLVRYGMGFRAVMSAFCMMLIAGAPEFLATFFGAAYASCG